MAKTAKPHVPETRERKPNREQRRHPERLASDSASGPAASQSSQQDLVKVGPPDVQSVRAKNSGHGKKTADKWNQ